MKAIKGIILTVIVIVLVSSNPAVSDDNEFAENLILEVCSLAYEYSGYAMKQRQAGKPITETMEGVKGAGKAFKDIFIKLLNISDLDEEQQEEVFAELEMTEYIEQLNLLPMGFVTAAYEVSILKRNSDKQELVSEFANVAYSSCIEGYLSRAMEE